MNPNISVRNVGISVARQTRKEAHETHLRLAEKEKIHLFDYDHLEITCGENKYALLLRGALGSAAEERAALMAARLLFILREKARLEPSSPFMGREQAAKMIWQHLPPKERAMFGSKPNAQLVYEACKSGLEDLQHFDGQDYRDIITCPAGKIGLNVPYDSVRFKLVGQPGTDVLEEAADHYIVADPSIISRGYENLSQEQLAELAAAAQAIIDGVHPDSQQQAVLMLDLVMNQGLRRFIEQGLSAKLLRPQMEAAHPRVKAAMGYIGYDAAVRARTIRSHKFNPGKRVKDTSETLNVSKVLKVMTTPAA